MEVLISAVFPIALVATAGFAVGRTFELDLQTLARVNIYAMLPALVLTSLMETTLALGSAMTMATAYLINTALLYLLAVVVSRSLKFSPAAQKSLMATTLFANVGNMGLPFVLFSLGEAGLERAILYLILASLLISSVFPMVLKGTGLREGGRFTLRLPVFWATLLGLGLQFWHGDLPQAVNRGITLLGEGAIPSALVILGIQLSRTQFAFGRYEFLGAGLRLLVSPATAYGVGRLLGLEGLDLQVLILQSAMPVAVNSLIWVTELGGDAVRVARTIVLSTLLSFATLPTILWLSSR